MLLQLVAVSVDFSWFWGTIYLKRLFIQENAMSDRMRSVPFDSLLERIFSELRGQNSIFSIPYDNFYKDDRKTVIKVFGQKMTTPLGPAAGPHTQLAQNIVTSFLTGARFIELKTVQIMDTLEIAKPCIDARDEGYNVEWSTEYTLPKAFDEYLKAWIAVHLLDMLMSDDWSEPSFIFNMSVGYNLEGIKSDKMQHFIASMEDADIDGKFSQYIGELKKALSEGLLKDTPWDGKQDKVIAKLGLISRRISPSVTLSTMHGCPPAEIEAICTYMLTEKKLDTFVKLNPTLLGYDEVRRILDTLGYDYVTLKRESFEHDLQYPDAVKMLHRLVDLAQKENRGFGVKLTNTLGNVNNQNVLPGEEMYMSGRALFPISTSVALKLSEEFDGKLPVSYSGGVNAFNVKDLYETGIHPVTVATDMLRPGGYMKMSQLAGIVKDSEGASMESIDVERLRKVNSAALTPGNLTDKGFRGTDSVKIGQPLPLLDCYVAPCVAACPIHQDIPEYVYLMGEGRYAEALAVILDKNALPNITGWICDHQCQRHCSRMDYEGAIAIRKIKQLAAQKGQQEYLDEIWSSPEEPADVRAAVVGAGPAGLSAALFLARAGFDVTLLERENKAGGVVRNVIPEFRIPEDIVQKDVDFIASNGVKMVFGADPDSLTSESLKAEGYNWIFYALGAEKPNDSRVSGNGKIIDAVSYLKAFKEGEPVMKSGKVVVMGGGNTAMDASRAAVRAGSSVTLVYRRSRDEMPCDAEEFIEAQNDGVRFRLLCNPVSFNDGILTLAVMKLGDRDESGRARPVDTGERITLECDLLISAIGEKVSSPLLEGLELEKMGDYLAGDHVFVVGDSVSGPSTVVRAMASSRHAVDQCIDLTLEELGQEDEDEDEDCCCHDHEHGDECHCHEHHHADGEECHCHDEEEDDDEMTGEEYTQKENEYFAQLVMKKTHVALENEVRSEEDFLRREAGRCLECSYLCNKCVDVCPNRANVSIDMRSYERFDDPFQIVHLDAYCNECGNCETFCPYSGGPYKKKFTLFSSEKDFLDSTNDGFFTEGDTVTVRLGGEVKKGVINSERELEIDIDEDILCLISEIFISYPYLLNRVDAD